MNNKLFSPAMVPLNNLDVEIAENWRQYMRNSKVLWTSTFVTIFVIVVLIAGLYFLQFKQENEMAHFIELQTKTNEINQKFDDVVKIINRNREARCNVARFADLKKAANDKKYFFAYHPLQHESNWTTAHSVCSKMNLHLAQIKDIFELLAVYTEASRVDDSERKGWWLSAKYADSEEGPGNFWHDGTKLEENSPMWRENANKTSGCVYFWTNET
ncbi:uncharacterized protein LOC132195528 [Neocloeon triangulifer]|uniref:uncharacterized protein LOC132195528 n=1 Tax=Neocloeon triangulifer TaxID=2078957 RepID=UPI00286EC723|nr:uncharacterized protein LOC132195528 [Neocloeon triangulifer]